MDAPCSVWCGGGVSALTLLACTGFEVLAADPSVTAASFVPNGDGSVTVTYTLDGDEPAIVTLDASLSGTPIGESGLFVRRVMGDANRIVEAGGTTHTATWWAREDLGDNPGNLANLTITVNAWKTNDPPAYMDYDLENKEVRYYTSSNALPGGAAVTGPYAGLYSEHHLLLRRINAANVRWQMGSVNEPGRDGSREVSHYVTMTNDYYMGIFELTKYQWIFIDGTNVFNRPDPGWIACDPLPISAISYDEIRGQYCYWPDAPLANSFLGKLRAYSGFDFDLPSETQWEFAARAGHYDGYWGDGSPIASTINVGIDANLDRMAWWRNRGKNATNVGSFAPNSWGIYDMYGNVWEWVLDVYQQNITANTYGQVVEPSNRNANNTMVVRGGCYYTNNGGCRSAQRGTNAANDKNANGKCGFRICLMLPGQEVLAPPYDEPRPFTPVSSLTTAANALDLTAPSSMVSDETTLDTLLSSEGFSPAGPLLTTKWIGTFLMVK
ncbi:MAG: formylglycine-generating enzyme family protein [Kiritimatiellae bacterium]|nr:formylglycine-generating enzyme family protein [Kiritimatiellia bacterium]